MRYIEASKEDLIALERGLSVIERIDIDKARDLDFYIYGLTNDQLLIDMAKEAIINSSYDDYDDNDEPTLREEDIELSEIAVALPLSSDTLYILMGSGIKAKELEFAYRIGEGEGIRTTRFSEANTTFGTVKLTNLNELVVADSDIYLDEYLKDKGNGTVAQINRNVQRTEEATVPVPHVPEPEKPPVANPVPPPPVQPKKTSLEGGLKLADAVEEFLG